MTGACVLFAALCSLALLTHAVAILLLRPLSRVDLSGLTDFAEVEAGLCMYPVVSLSS
jgi:hypothetical protein